MKIGTAHIWKAYKDLDELGQETSPRGLLVKERENYSYELPPYERFASFKARNLNLNYIKAEFVWYLVGNRHDLSICKEAKIWNGIVVEDELGRSYLNSNYGYYIFRKNGFDWCLGELTRDKDSRRASITILGSEPEHFTLSTKDMPCTYSMNFRIRDNALNMSVHMRSQDAIFGLGNDAPCFSFVHEMLFTKLKEIYPSLEMGYYHHTADSFHVYERHFKMFAEILRNPESDWVECPKMTLDDVNFMLEFWQNFETSEILTSETVEPNTQTPFVNWLFSRDSK